MEYYICAHVKVNRPLLQKVNFFLNNYLVKTRSVFVSRRKHILYFFRKCLQTIPVAQIIVANLII